MTHYDHDEHKQTPRFHSNILAEYEQFVHQAAKTTGFDIVVSNDTYNNRASHISVWTNEPPPRDHGPFWREYRRLVDTVKTE